MGKSMSTAGRGAGDRTATDNRRPEPTTNIRSLPTEILPLIFAHLPAKECKNVRLTCRTWYKHSFARAIAQKQKFVFTEGDGLEKIAKFLLRSTDIVVLNLEFRNLCMSSLPSSVWKKCGHQIHTLCFRKCEHNCTFLVNMTLYCVNLTSLEVIEMDDCGDDCGGRKQIDADSPSNGMELLQMGVRRTTLRTFVWFDDSYLLPTGAVKHFFLMFPCLTRFGMGPEPSYDYQLHTADEPDQSTDTNFDECLDSSTTLERIVYNNATDGSWMTRSILKPEWSSRLIELQTVLRYENLPDFGRELLFGVFAAQTNLQVVTLNELDGDEVFIKELMFCIFENCRDLRELQLRFKNDDATRASLMLRSVNFATYSEFARLFSSLAKLECFVVNFDIECGFPSDLLATLPSTSFAMERLHLDQSRMSEQFCRSVLQRCSKLTYLKVTIVLDDLLQEIFKNADLQTLLLVTFLYHEPGHGTLTDYGFTGRSGTGGRPQGLSIKCLQNLEHLKLSIYDRFHVSRTGWRKRNKNSYTRHSGVTVESIRELKFPRLKSLDLSLELDSELTVYDDFGSDESDEAPSPTWFCGVRPITKLPGNILIDLATNLPDIEKLEITPVPQDFAAILKMCKMSKHLSSLRCSRVAGFNVDRLFAWCPHLMNLMLFEEGDVQREQFRRRPLMKDIQCRVLRRV